MRHEEGQRDSVTSWRYCFRAVTYHFLPEALKAVTIIHFGHSKLCNYHFFATGNHLLETMKSNTACLQQGPFLCGHTAAGSQVSGEGHWFVIEALKAQKCHIQGMWNFPRFLVITQRSQDLLHS